MESRKITIVTSKSQRTVTIMSAATTLKELKRDMKNNNINYEGMDFYEGVSKTELKTDESVLPQNVPFKGSVTNELVFMLTNTNKKIKSGADFKSRVDYYNVIKTKGLQDKFREVYGKNYTNAKTQELVNFVSNYSNTGKSEVKQVKTKSIETKPVEVKTVETKKEQDNNNLKDAFMALVNILYNNDVIDCSEKDEVFDILEEKTTSEGNTEKSSYSQSDINEMFRDMGL